ncbi:MAG TPA: glutaminyl-peptide cyclotransferase [Actinomycetota bacterium]|nr:glutaminyl-peptide cyclotransferase [Actinomycetota bacterium]
MRPIRALAVLMAVLAGLAPETPAPGASSGASDLQTPEYEIVATYPHDPEAFTQGLAFARGQLYEGTGLNGASSLRKVDLETGEVLMKRDLAEEYFGEGITAIGRRIWQITWQSEVAFLYDRRNFKVLRRFNYKGEGWGLADANGRLIMSNGTNRIVFRDPETFRFKRRIEVTEDGAPVERLNELEWVNGQIFANVWQTDYIVRIDPATGNVLDRIDLSELHAMEQAQGDPDVTNGIAYLPDADRLFVTGKNWSHIYEIRLL